MDQNDPDSGSLPATPVAATLQASVGTTQQESWIEPTNRNYRQRLYAITNHQLDKIIHALKSVTHPRLKYPLQVIGYDHESGRRNDDLPVDPAHYVHAQLRVATEPLSEEGTILKDGYFGYNLGDDFRRAAPFNFIRLGNDGQVLEMGFGSDLAMQTFKHHLLGHKLSGQERERIREIQEKTVAYLRNHPESKQQLEAFARSASRQWPKGLEDI